MSQSWCPTTSWAFESTKFLRLWGHIGAHRGGLAGPPTYADAADASQAMLHSAADVATATLFTIYYAFWSAVLLLIGGVILISRVRRARMC